jgi:uncharacterized membrane protein YhaH (DUF805 family)
MSTDQLDLSALVPDAPGWYPDPDGRHHYRYHDGSAWTDHVADDGQTAIDPRPSSLPPPAMPVPDDEVVILEPEESDPEAAQPEVTEPALAEPALAEPALAGPPAGASVLAPPVVAPHGASPAWPAQEPMGLDEAVRRGFRQYATFSGRAPRSEYWGFMAVTQLLVLLAGALPAFAIGGLVRGTDAAWIVGSLMLLLAAMAVALPSLAVSVRRLHDSDRPGTTLLFGLVPLAGPVIITVLMLFAGTHGPNRYGEPVVPDGPRTAPLVSIATALRVPVLMGLFLAVMVAASEMGRAYALMMPPVAFWGRWIVAASLVAVLSVVLLAGRRLVHSYWLLALEGATAAALGLVPQLPWAGPWVLTELVQFLGEAGWDLRFAFYGFIDGFAGGLALVLGLVWLGVVAVTATRPWWTRGEVP